MLCTAPNPSTTQAGAKKIMLINRTINRMSEMIAIKRGMRERDYLYTMFAFFPSMIRLVALYGVRSSAL